MYKRSQKMLEMCDLFRSANGHLSYETIEQHFGKPIDEMRPTAYSARKALEKDESIVFECIPKVGYKRLNDIEKIESLKTFTRRIQRTTKDERFNTLRKITIEILTKSRTSVPTRKSKKKFRAS